MESQQQQQNSVWRSPVPYLFRGLAAMLGLIAFALLILACSYWKLSGYLGAENVARAAAPAAADGDVEINISRQEDTIKVEAVFEEKIVVIMAGDEKPTFLATPISTASSIDESDRNCKRMPDDPDQHRIIKP
ncbi:Protein GLUTAMINE DUMPER 3 [Zostera marina]|uniref:Protein GLUTAMINE DUMPER 3 n=1 Tax=Zostera marina TaxID=29655 RepID=A0A0K9P761_ZOSMR|nr:Protein GLUTAMINE DUMPER 3 [Zostera marina]